MKLTFNQVYAAFPCASGWKELLKITKPNNIHMDDWKEKQTFCLGEVMCEIRDVDDIYWCLDLVVPRWGVNYYNLLLWEKVKHLVTFAPDEQKIINKGIAYMWGRVYEKDTQYRKVKPPQRKTQQPADVNIHIQQKCADLTRKMYTSSTLYTTRRLVLNFLWQLFRMNEKAVDVLIGNTMTKYEAASILKKIECYPELQKPITKPPIMWLCLKTLSMSGGEIVFEEGKYYEQLRYYDAQKGTLILKNKHGRNHTVSIGAFGWLQYFDKQSESIPPNK